MRSESRSAQGPMEVNLHLDGSLGSSVGLGPRWVGIAGPVALVRFSDAEELGRWAAEELPVVITLTSEVFDGL